MDARLIVDDPASGAWNMALDDALLESAGRSGGACLRFYGWSRPTVSLGYFQPYRDRLRHPGSCSLPLVRRATGGGAIVHDHELTYSFVAPLADRFSADGRWLLQTFHETLISAVATWKIRAALCQSPVRFPRGNEPFLCFQRRSRDDVLVGGHKIAGSAQRRRHGAILQHGSVLLRASSYASDLRGVSDLAGEEITAPALIGRWTALLATRLGIPFVDAPPTAREVAAARAQEARRFGSKDWTCKR